MVFLSGPSRSQPPKFPFDFRADTTSPKNVSFIGDSSEAKFTVLYNRVIDSAYGMNKNYDFQFRLWKLHLSFNFDKGFVLTLKNNRWVARYFERKYTGNDKIVLTEKSVDQSKVNQLWELLVQNEVLSLPDQKLLEDRMVTYKVDTTDLFNQHTYFIGMTDGILYSFELSTPTKNRFYRYGNPQE